MKYIVAMSENLKRRIVFEPMKDSEKIGFSLQERTTKVRSVKNSTQAYWKGVKENWSILSVNDVPVDINTVRPSLKGVCSGTDKFCVLFEMDQPFRPKLGKQASIDRKNAAKESVSR